MGIDAPVSEPRTPRDAAGTDANSVRPKRIGLIAARSKDEARDLSGEVARALRKAGAEVVPEVSLGKGAGGRVDAIVVLGGDGLMMRAANAYPDVPLLGINFGNVGFLALVERRDWRHAIEALLAGSHAVQEGPTLQATMLRNGASVFQGWAINDVVVRSGIRMVDVEIYIDGHYVNTYPGDGLIVATPHGSTAYGMAAGGPILTAGVRGFAIVPISCHSPIRTPFVVPEEATIELVVANDHEASLILDGREEGSLQRWDIVRVARGRHAFRLVTLATTNFYEAFRTKFNFRIRPDAIPSRGTKRRAEGLAPSEPLHSGAGDTQRPKEPSAGPSGRSGAAALEPWLLSVLVCPVDQGRLRAEADALVCETCDRRYPVRDGIPVMLPDEAEIRT